MRKTLRLAVAGVFAAGLVLAARASAQLSEVDLVSGSGDAKVTFDAATGLYWLDVPETTNLSVPEVLAGAGGWVAHGWRYATATEICALFAAYALAVPNCGTFQPGQTTGDVLSTLQGFLGLTIDDSNSRATSGFFDDFGDPARVGLARLTYTISADQSVSLVQNDATFAAAIPNQGNWLVRDTPPPDAVPALPWRWAAWLLLALLIVGPASYLLARPFRG